MRGKHPQRVVDPRHEPGPLELVHRPPRYDPGSDTDNDGAPAIDETGGGSDADEPRYHAVDRADDGRLAVGHLVHQRPDEKGYCGGSVGVEHGGTRIVISKIGVAAVEAVPTQP